MANRLGCRVTLRFGREVRWTRTASSDLAGEAKPQVDGKIEPAGGPKCGPSDHGVPEAMTWLGSHPLDHSGEQPGLAMAPDARVSPASVAGSSQLRAFPA